MRMKHDWFNMEFINRCMELDAEPAITNDKILFIVPKMPDETIQAQLKGMVPVEVTPQIVVGIKNTTLVGLKLLFEGVGASALVVPQDHGLMVEIRSDSPVFEPESEIWNFVKVLLDRDKYIQTYEIKVNGSTVLTHEPERTVEDRTGHIPDSDMVDLKIALETSNTVEDFLKQIGG